MKRTPKPRRYQLPDFLFHMALTQDRFEKWLRGRAAAQLKRDRKRGNICISATGEAYRMAIYQAVVHSKGRDHYTGEALDWSLIGTYSNAESKAKTRAYKATLALLPSIDHVGDGLGEVDFKLCAWRTNDAKNDLTHEAFVSLCRRVVAYFDGPVVSSLEHEACQVVPDLRG